MFLKWYDSEVKVFDYQTVFFRDELKYPDLITGFYWFQNTSWYQGRTLVYLLKNCYRTKVTLHTWSYGLGIRKCVPLSSPLAWLTSTDSSIILLVIEPRLTLRDVTRTANSFASVLHQKWKIFLPLILKWLPIEIFREHWNWFLKNLLFSEFGTHRCCRSITKSALKQQVHVHLDRNFSLFRKVASSVS